MVLTKNDGYIAELIKWDSSGLAKLTGSVSSIEKPYDHYRKKQV
jgi:hypothetical protein